MDFREREVRVDAEQDRSCRLKDIFAEQDRANDDVRVTRARPLEGAPFSNDLPRLPRRFLKRILVDAHYLGA
jgi:hypothetical protein